MNKKLRYFLVVLFLPPLFSFGQCFDRYLPFEVSGSNIAASEAYIYTGFGIFNPNGTRAFNYNTNIVWPTDVVLGLDGNVYIADIGDFNVKVFTKEGVFIKVIPSIMAFKGMAVDLNVK